MADRQAVFGKQGLGLGPAEAGLEGRGHRDQVDSHEPVEAGEVEADQAGVPLTPSGQAARHTGAAAEGHDRDVVLDRRGQDRCHLVVAARPDDGVGRVVEVAGAGLRRSGVDLPRVRRRRTSSSRSTWSSPTALRSAAERVLREAGRRQDTDDGLDCVGRPEDRLDERAGALRQWCGGGRVAPALGVHLSRHALQCDM